MALYYIFSSLLAIIALYSTITPIAKMITGNAGNTGFPDYRPITKRDLYVNFGKSIFSFILYLLLVAAPTLKAAPVVGKFFLGFALIFLAIETVLEFWDGFKDIKKYRVGVEIGKARVFLPKPEAIAVVVILAAIQLVLVLAATKFVYL